MCSTAYYRDNHGIWRRVGWPNTAPLPDLDDTHHDLVWTPRMSAIMGITHRQVDMVEIRQEREEKRLEAEEVAREQARRLQWRRNAAKQERERLKNQEREEQRRRDQEYRDRQNAGRDEYIRRLLAYHQRNLVPENKDTIETLCEKARLTWGC